MNKIKTSVIRIDAYKDVTDMKKTSRYLLIAALVGCLSPALFASPVTIDHSTGHIEVAVQINGKGPYKFLLDTGATGHGRIDSKIARELFLPVTGQTLNDDGSGRNLTIVNQHRIDSLLVGDRMFYDLSFMAQNFHEAEATDMHIDGILGFELFENLLLTIDYKFHHIYFTEGALSPDDPHTISFDPGESKKRCFIPVKIGNTTFMAVLDTGNQGGLTVPHRIVRQLDLAGRPQVYGYAKTTNNEYTLYESDPVAPVEIAGFTLPEVTVKSARFWRTPNIGYQLLCDFVITIDQKNHLVCMRRP